MTPNVIPNHILERLWAAGEIGEWREYAACKGSDPSLFFPGLGEETRAAKAVCGGCEVRPECLAYALQAHEKFGIWGGRSERERRKMRRGQVDLRRDPPINHGTPYGYRAHRRRGEEACGGCKEAYAADQAIRNADTRERARQAVRDRNTANPATAELAARAQDGVA